MSMKKTKIEWCTHTWNPVTGCYHGCDYCYARRQTARFQPHVCERPEVKGMESGILECGGAPHNACFEIKSLIRLVDETGAYVRTTPYPMGFAPTLHSNKLNDPQRLKTPARIFVCSMADLFGKWVPDAWIKQVFDACRKAPWHTYLFLTKNPDRYLELAGAGKLPEDKNFWYGSTATSPDMPFWWSEYHNTFVSIEPLLKPFESAGDAGDGGVKKVGWVIIGAMTGPGSRNRQPRREWVEVIVEDARAAGVPVFMKDSLKPIWGDELIREHPPDMLEQKSEPVNIPRCKTCEHASHIQQGKRGVSRACHIGWELEDHDDGGRDRHIPGQHTRTSPPWCPLRKKGE